MYTYSLTTTSPQETFDVGKRLAYNYLEYQKGSSEPVVLKLNGDLGLGKTVLVKGLAKGLGIPDTLTSPSYTYLEEYVFHVKDKQFNLIHLDAWRIDSNKLARSLKVEENYLKINSLLVFEWPEKYPFTDWSKSHYSVNVNFNYISEYARKIDFASENQELIDFE